MPDAPVLVGVDGERRLTWEPVEAAAEYVVYAGDEERLRTVETDVAMDGVWDPEVATAFGVAAVSESGAESEVSRRAPYFPPEERQHENTIWRGTEPITAGERGSLQVRTGRYTGLLSRFEVAFEVESAADAASIVDVDPVDVVADLDGSSIPDGGAESVSATVSFPDAPVPGGTQILELTVEGVDAGDVTVDADVSAVYADLEAPIDQPVDPAEFAVEVPESPPAPATVDAVGVDTDAVEVEWAGVERAVEYEVYVAGHEVPTEDGESDPGFDPAEQDPVLRTVSEGAIVDGLDSLTTYDVGVVAVDDYGGASPVATTVATTAATEHQVDDGPEIDLAFDHESVVPGERTSATLTLTEREHSLSSWLVEVRVDDTAVASIDEVSVDEAFEVGEVVARDADDQWATLSAVQVDSEVEPDEDLELATLELETSRAGRTAVDVIVAGVHALVGDGMELPTRPGRATVDVSRDNWQGEFEVDGEVVEPRDLDGDGLYRDVDGDGTVAQSDVVAFFEHQHRPVVETHSELFDYTGNGAAGHGDVVELFEYVFLDGA